MKRAAAPAQQAPSNPDLAFLQKATAVLQTQRNAALDGQAAAEARAAVLADENAALKKQIDDLRKPESKS